MKRRILSARDTRFIFFSLLAIIPSAVQCFALNFPLNNSITRSAVSVTLHTLYLIPFYYIIPAIFAAWGICCAARGNAVDLLKAYAFYYVPLILIYLTNPDIFNFMRINIYHFNTPLILTLIFSLAYILISSKLTDTTSTRSLVLEGLAVLVIYMALGTAVGASYSSMLEKAYARKANLEVLLFLKAMLLQGFTIGSVVLIFLPFARRRLPPLYPMLLWCGASAVFYLILRVLCDSISYSWATEYAGFFCAYSLLCAVGMTSWLRGRKGAAVLALVVTFLFPFTEAFFRIYGMYSTRFYESTFCYQLPRDIRAFLKNAQPVITYMGMRRIYVPTAASLLSAILGSLPVRAASPDDHTDEGQ